MTYNVSLPLTGISGWKFPRANRGKTEGRVRKERRRSRGTSPGFTEKRSARSRRPRITVGDRRLLKVALGAFGLGDDIDKEGA